MHYEPPGATKFRGYSAGSQPRGNINPHALAVLRKSNFDVSQLRSKSWDEFTVQEQKLDFVCTICDNLGLPDLAGAAHERSLGFADPAKAQGTEAEQASRLRRRASACSISASAFS